MLFILTFILILNSLLDKQRLNIYIHTYIHWFKILFTIKEGGILYLRCKELKNIKPKIQLLILYMNGCCVFRSFSYLFIYLLVQFNSKVEDRIQ